MTASKYIQPGRWSHAKWAGRCASASCRGDGQIFTGEPIWCTRPPARTYCGACGRHLQAIQRQAEAQETEARIGAAANAKKLGDPD